MLRRIFLTVLVLTGICSTSMVSGCFGSPDGPKKYRLSGKVTYQGKLVPMGEVRLVPDSEAGNQGPASIAMIYDGHYQTRDGYGIIGGSYNVLIRGYEAADSKNQNPNQPPAMEKELFPAYETTFAFEHANTVHDFEIPEMK